MYVNNLFIFSIWLLISCCISSQFQKVAEDKGYAETKYFWLCFFFGIVGYLLVIALPNKKLMSLIAQTTRDTTSDGDQAQNNDK